MSIYLDYKIQVGCLKGKICAKQDTYPRQQVSIVMLPTTLNGKLPGLSPLGGSCVPSEEPREQRSNAGLRSVKKEEEIGVAFFDLLYASTPQFGVKGNPKFYPKSSPRKAAARSLPPVESRARAMCYCNKRGCWNSPQTVT